MPISKQKNILTASCFGKMKYMYIENRHQRQWWICFDVWATWQCLMGLIRQAARAGSRSGWCPARCQWPRDLLPVPAAWALTTQAQSVQGVTSLAECTVQGTETQVHFEPIANTGHRWIPPTKGQKRGKCFHLMTSSCEPTGPRHHAGCRSADARPSVTTMPTLQLLNSCTPTGNNAGDMSAGRQTVNFFIAGGLVFLQWWCPLWVKRTAQALPLWWL